MRVVIQETLHGAYLGAVLRARRKFVSQKPSREITNFADCEFGLSTFTKLQHEYPRAVIVLVHSAIVAAQARVRPQSDRNRNSGHVRFASQSGGG
jgi:hypothetical protein